MPEEKVEKKPEMSDLKKTQQELRKQIKELEGVISEKSQLAGYDREKELGDMVKVALRQNKRLADKVDYLMDTLIEASQEVGEETIEKTLASLAKAQIELMDQVVEMKKKVAAAEDIKELRRIQEKSLKDIEQRISAVGDTLSKLPYSAQINALKKEVDGLGGEVKTLESIVTTKAPEEVTLSIDMLKQDLSDLKLKVGGLGKSLSRIEIEQRKSGQEISKIIPHLTSLDVLQAKVSSLENSLENMSAMLKKEGLTSKEIFEKISTLKTDLIEAEKLREEVDKIPQIRAEEKEKVFSLLERLKEIESGVDKIESWIETYPIGDAQQISFLKEKFDNIEREIRNLKQKDLQNMMRKEMDKFRDRMNEIENTFEKRGLDIHKKQEKELQLILDTLKKIESKLSQAEKKEDLNTALKSLHKTATFLKGEIEKTKVKKDKVAEGEIKQIKEQINKELWEPISRVEEETRKERLASPIHVSKLKEDIGEIKKKVETAQGEVVKPEIVSSLKEKIGRIEPLPTQTVEKERIPEIKKTLEETKISLEEIGRPKEVKEIGKVIEKAKAIGETIEKHEVEVVKTKEVVSEAKKHAKEILLKDKDTVLDFIKKLPVGVDTPLKDISEQLNMPLEDVKRILKQLKKEKPDEIDLRNISYSSKLLGREPILKKIK